MKLFFELLLVPLDGTPVQRIATGLRERSQIVSWAPDGKHLVYAHPDGLFLVSTQSGEQKICCKSRRDPSIFYATVMESIW